jgi:regulation of enolase protein 1 (concanavalin A-like superfamily)
LLVAGITVALSLVLLAAADSRETDAVFRDDFKGKLADGWAWVREDKNAWKLGDGFLQVRPLPGNLWEGENGAKNLLLREPPAGAKAFVAEVTLSHTPLAFGEQSGLLWYADDDNYVKLTKEFYDDKTWVVLAAERGGKAEYAEAECRAEWVTLRLTVTADGVSGAFMAVGGTDWKPVGNGVMKFPRAEKSRIGLTAHHGPQGVERWATFTQFNVFAER